MEAIELFLQSPTGGGVSFNMSIYTMLGVQDMLVFNRGVCSDRQCAMVFSRMATVKSGYMFEVNCLLRSAQYLRELLLLLDQVPLLGLCTRTACMS